MDSVTAVLKKVWGYDSLRPIQDEAIRLALEHRDGLVVMPTGGGKSLCFQLPALVTDSLTVVVSPLIALMKDQVDALRALGVEAAALNSSMGESEAAEVERRALKGSIRLLYVSPERLLLEGTISLLRRAGVRRFAIDEAHCISGWGHDFRPEYRQLSRLRELFPEISVQAFTATATERVQRDIAIQLAMVKPRRFVGTFDRANLTYRVIAKSNAAQQMAEQIRRFPDEGVIVYCLSRADTEKYATALRGMGVEAVAYHAGLSAGLRSQISEDFSREKANVIVATVAFGMGIDRSNVRCVIHECLPKSMEGYQQETGRAGRDGGPSECILLYNHGDITRIKRLIEGGEAELVKHQLGLIEEVRRYLTSQKCRHQLLSEYFGQVYEVQDGGCGSCDNCLGGVRKMHDGEKVGLQILQGHAEFVGLSGTRSFGVGLFVEFLVGRDTKALKERKASRGSLFGCLRELGKERVQLAVFQMIDENFLAITPGKFPFVVPGEKFGSAISGEMQVELFENPAMISTRATAKSKGGELFELLRKWRREEAEKRGVAPFIVFSDAVLQDVASARPMSLADLKKISGMGSRKIESYGSELLRIVAEVRGQGSKLQTVDSGLPRYVAACELFEKGVPVEDIALEIGVTPNTVAGYLEQFIGEGRLTVAHHYLDDATMERCFGAFRMVGTSLLKPAFEYLNEEVNYLSIRVARAVWAHQNESI